MMICQRNSFSLYQIASDQQRISKGAAQDLRIARARAILAIASHYMVEMKYEPRIYTMNGGYMTEKVATAPVLPGHRLGTARIAESPVDAIKGPPQQSQKEGVRIAEAPKLPGHRDEEHKSQHKK